MKKFILLYFAILLFDVIYSVFYSSIVSAINIEFLKYPFIIINYLSCSPAIFFNRLLPFYLPLPTYQSFLILFGNVFLQTLLIYTIFFKKKNNQKHIS
ncbi:hypothetical protein [Chryseobacterium turcicum]|uniref:Uncharacterized protein n=1 Tax=Chryseobacterium turcicum TaxID=2898076 RepID=A0A9Q3V5Y3_9FLAO|nr:hypothetical protein [Chryseobacterium turcicum]MCD1117936.1 hypothetical protein [Chryseobacterium turcicum]